MCTGEISWAYKTNSQAYKKYSVTHVYYLPEINEIAQDQNISDVNKFILLKKIMEEFKNRYGVNSSIYEFCRFRNVPIPEQFAEDQLDPLCHMPILQRMLLERVRKLGCCITWP